MRILLVAPSRSDPAHRRVLAALKQRLTDAGDEVVTFPPRDGLTSHQARARLERSLQDPRLDICHVQYFSRGLDYLGLVRFPSRLKLILTHQGASFGLMEHRGVFGRLALRADAATAVSANGLREMAALFPRLRRKSRAIPNGVDFLRPSGPPHPKFSKGSFILSVGRLAAYKGTDVLLMAFAELAARDAALDLVICGPDQTGGKISRFARVLGLRGRVHFLGDTKPPPLRRLLEDCLFFVLPSRRENMPMALLEAMAAGKAAIAARVGGTPEVVTDGVDGLLVPPQDALAMAEAMLRLARSARLRKRLGLQASKRARSFTWSAVAARYRRLYAEVAGIDDPPR